MKIRPRVRLEQDYWLSFSDFPQATEEERQDFHAYDSQGTPLPVRERVNPIYLGKVRHGQYGEVLRDSYFGLDGGWIGGINIVEDYLEREPFQCRPLVEWFGEEAVRRWLEVWWTAQWVAAWR